MRGDFNADGQRSDRRDLPTADVPRSFDKAEWMRGTLKASLFPLPDAIRNGTLPRNYFHGPGYARFNLNEALEIIVRVAAPKLGLLLDTYHSYLEAPDVYEALASTRGLLKHIHLHDSDRGPAGSSNGVLDFDRIIRILRDFGYAGSLSDGLLTTALPEEQVMRSLHSCA